MKKLDCIAVILVAACATSITINPAAAAAAKKKKQQQLTSIQAIRMACIKEIGATRQGGYWYTQGGIGTAQQQRFYDCLDRYTMNKR